MDNHTYVAIMAGGVGSRFWPASREDKPKQFLDIAGDGRSLLRMTFERFLKLTTADKIFIVTNGKYRDLVQEHLPEIGSQQILCEPSRNNTAPCVAYAAFKLQNIDPEANFVIAPSDALIVNDSLFAANINKALRFTAANDALVTLGISPDAPHTGYGYIQYLDEATDTEDVYRVKRFAEKPDLETAKSFLRSGDYLWNAGIFIWRAKTILDAYEQYAPEIYALLSQGLNYYNTEEEQSFIDEFYPQTPSISVDYAIMENAANIFTIPAQFGWSDLGAWGALYQESSKDEDGNVITGQVIIEDTHNSLIRAPKDKLVVVGGVDDLLVIDEGDVLLVYPRNREQEIKALRAKAESAHGEKFV
ncbi:mannose-1-phosphate guanylyltransferase [Neolewinella xylanilytica]|uniref:mannose-1-phosphate guanylyltransferase n=1 Tax=Neolewinella xylanilytica TaxID=1514080 RepID=A0A2S6I2T4_9BACT|nr:mannose-1-phosphate guanylyltransferase [Neolewinella xylanilytica]PPK85487.1 mannose-1-phosphate guanylyltransferase [Neolewinella xylanilytica]